ncbi:hypothetical protein ACWC9U_05515 [Streptomyces sp. 900116325]
MSDDDKTPAREVIADYTQAHFRYFRTAERTVYAQIGGVESLGIKVGTGPSEY